MTTQKLSKLLATATLAAAAALTACGGGDDGPLASSDLLLVANDGTSSFSATALGISLQALPIQPLSPEEQASLAFMREEEKLAHDVYARLDVLWSAQTRTFGNIATSEATHTEAVRQLLLRYALTDPAATLTSGVYASADLQALHDSLVTQGAASLVQALQVGALIEEVDIADLQHALALVDNEDIRTVYLNLMKGSRNHLRSFVGALSAQGITYVPQVLDITSYTAIVTTPYERGR